MAKKELKAILFDLDGTLLDTNELIIKSFLHILNKYFPGQYERDDVLPFMGPSLHDTFGKLNPDKVDQMVEEYRAYNIKMHDEIVEEFPGVYETVEKLANNNIKMAIVTTKKHDVAVQGLKLFNLDHFFDAVIAYDNVENTKPDPEGLYLALEKLQVEPAEAIMVGDNYHDIVGGQNAGTKTAGVAWSLKGRDFLAKYEPDYMLEKIEDILPIIGIKA